LEASGFEIDMKDRTRFEREIADLYEQTNPLKKQVFRVIDAREAPLSGVSYALYQEGRVDAGTLNARGEGQFGQVDPSRAFRLHIEARVCCVVEGAVLLTEEEGVEYGGQFVDWRLADDPKKADRDFWPHYTKARKAKRIGPITFWQHDHITRRPVRLRHSYSSLPSKVAVFQASPLWIRTGPLVRYMDDRQAIICVELETPGIVRVRFRKADDRLGVPKKGTALREIDMQSRHSATVRVGGRHFAMVQVTGLREQTIYQYTLELAPLPLVNPIPSAESAFTPTVFPSTLPAECLAAYETQLTPRSFRADKWLFFRTLHRNYAQLRFAHGSCRKWPGDTDAEGNTPGPDMLDLFGTEWMMKQKIFSEWPSFFLHTGDQIYADDIGINDGRIIMSQRFSARVPGPKPKPGDPQQELTWGAWAGRFSNRFLAIHAGKVSQSAPIAPLQEQERELLKQAGQLSADISAIAKTKHSVTSEMLTKIKESMKSTAKLAEVRRHLKAAHDRNLPSNYITDSEAMRFKQQINNHLLWTIPVEPKDVPEVTPLGLRRRDTGKSFYSPAGDLRGVHAADFSEYSYLYEQAWATGGARKVLAHIPSFMMFDDHEVTDDWNFNRRWVEIVHHSQGDPYRMWPFTITDGLISYWMYQGWGNIAPDLWTSDPRIQILERARSEGTDALPELRKLVFARATQPAPAQADPAIRLKWYYSLPIQSPRFLVVDDRTEREVFGPSRTFAEQLQWLQEQLQGTRGPAAFVVFPTPYLLAHPISWALVHKKASRAIKFLVGLFSVKWDWKTIEQLSRSADMEHAAGNLVWDHVKAMLAKLQDSVTSLKTITFVSGDIHFSCNLDGRLKKLSPPSPPHLLQLVSSGLCQKVEPDKQTLLKTAYKYLWFDTTGTHRDLIVRLAGLDGGKDKPNLLFRPSVALVDVDVRKNPDHPRIDSELPNVAIRQVHLTWNGNSKPPKIESYDFHYANNDAEGPRLLTPARNPRA
jgi:hypothetical protein